MDTLIDFFTLRPVFTMWGLRLVWLLVLTQQAIGLAAMYSSAGQLGWRSWIAAMTLFNAALYLVLVRLLIEVAAAVLIRPQPRDTRD
jgi:hypothetical protein